MISRKIWLPGLIIVIGLIGAVCLYAKVNSNGSAPAAAKSVWICSAGQKPCIALVDSNQQVIAKFNDFRFLPNHCIAYNQAGWKVYCHAYQLKWIGPTSHKQTTSV